MSFFPRINNTSGCHFDTVDVTVTAVDDFLEVQDKEEILQCVNVKEDYVENQVF